MLTLTLILASLSASVANTPAANEIAGPPAKIESSQLGDPDLTLMQGYDRYLADPKMMLRDQRDA